ncbi:MAG: BON domain-containing protein [Gammaproteobacteria bacterium]
MQLTSKMQSRKTMRGTATATAAVALMVSGLAMSTMVSPAWAADSASRSVGVTMDDAAITASVKTRLVADGDTKARQINVETSKGVVQLNGFVDSAGAKSEAARIAAGTDGVTRVQNNLQVRTPDSSASEAADNAGLTAKVDAALARDPRTSALSIDVESRSGEVQLSGYVKSAQEKNAASDVARKVDGVRKVTNDIDLR